MDEDYMDIDPTPLGAASIGQVHRAVRRSDGKGVVIKVMFPEAEKFFYTDMETMKRFTGLAQVWCFVPMIQPMISLMKNYEIV